MSAVSEPREYGAMPPGSVIITPAQMYSEIRIMSEKVDKLATVVDPALSTIREDLGGVRIVQADHESRLRAIDRRLWLAAVVAAASGAGIAQLVPLLAP